MKYIHNLTDKYSSRIANSGGKGANLHKLIKSGFKVPAGFVINTTAFDHFIKQNGLISKIIQEIDSSEIENNESISTASKNIKREIENAKIPEKIVSQIENELARFEKLNFKNQYAVRSSGVFEDNAKNSWAGQFDSYLELEKNEVSKHIKKCWASFFNSRAINYNIRAYSNIKKMKFAVIVQEMVESEISGVGFSVEPNENNKNKILIEAAPGLGENYVSGKESAFKVFIDKKQKVLLNNPNNFGHHSGLLSIQQIDLITDGILKIEKLFKKPMDIEWAIASGEIYYLQARPITGLERKLGQKDTSSFPAIKDYELTFKVSGLSFLFTDMLSHGFKYLDPLFTSNTDGQFNQYFTNDKMEYASKYGLDMFSKPNGFIEFQTQFTNYYNDNIVKLNNILQKKLTKTSTNQFFQILSNLFTFYSKTDNQFTNLAFLYSNENPTIGKNLEFLSKFKDVARVWINNTSLEPASQFSKFIEKVSQEFSIEITELENYKISEIIQLFYGEFVEKEEIENRKFSYTIYHLSDKFFYITGKKSAEYIAEISSQEKMLLNSEIKGQVANNVQKIVKGKVRVINVNYADFDLLDKQIDEMEQDEILVAEFTAPELISACRKAKAIVTDIGGLLSHAAIVSRELNIPCLVGTHNATKNLKTGDEIIIDFDFGIVNKI